MITFFLNMEGFQMVINLLVMSMFFFSGAMYPVKALPGWLKISTISIPCRIGLMHYDISSS